MPTEKQRKHKRLNRLQTKLNESRVIKFTPEELECIKQTFLRLDIETAIAEYRHTATAEEREYFLTQGIDIDTMNRNDVKRALDYILRYQWLCNIEKS